MKETRPIIITDKDTGEKYTLEFSRETVIFTDNQGFRISEFEDRMPVMLPILWYGAFRMHHKGMSRTKTDDILYNKLGGLEPEGVLRLAALYGAARDSLVHEKSEEEIKNAKATMEW